MCVTHFVTKTVLYTEKSFKSFSLDRRQTDIAPYGVFFVYFKGQLISKANGQAVNSSKKRTNDFVFTSMRRVFVSCLEEIEDTKKKV